MAMNQRIRQNHVGAATMAISFAILVIIIGGAESRDLRPSDHGLPFQSNYPARSPEMALFFGEEVSPPAKRPPAPPTILGNSSSAVPDSWWKGREEDRVRKALMVATVVCGGTGVVLLAAAAVLFAVHFRRQRAISSTYSAPGNNNNSTAIVVAAPSPTTITKGMPLHRVFDRNKKFRRMDEDESVFVYREGTLDQASYNFYHLDQNNVDGGSPNFEQGSIRLHTKRSNMSVGTIVPLKDIII